MNGQYSLAAVRSLLVAYIQFELIKFVSIDQSIRSLTLSDVIQSNSHGNASNKDTNHVLFYLSNTSFYSLWIFNGHKCCLCYLFIFFACKSHGTDGSQVRRTRFRLHHFYLLLNFLGFFAHWKSFNWMQFAVNLFFSRSVFVSCFHMEVRRNCEVGRQYSAKFFMKMKYVLWYFCCSWPKRTIFECHFRSKSACICTRYVYCYWKHETRHTHTHTLVRARITNTNIRPQNYNDWF